MLEQNKNPISPLVAGQLPDFVKIDHPTLNSFLSAYYEWLDKDTTYLRSPKRLNEVIDIDTTMDEFVAKFKNEFLFDFPETLAELDDGTTVDASKLVKNIKSFYKAKGTEKTYDFLFRILYDTGVEFYYPKKDILKLSHGKWILKKTIKLSNFLGSTIFDSIGETVKQRNSQGEITASGRVMDATTYRVGIYEIAELSLGGINGAFDVAKGEVEFVDNYGNVRKENRIFPVIGEVTITTAGSGYLLGDRVVLTPAAGDTGLNALGRVSEISSTGGVKKVMMYNLGVNYKVSPTISIISELGKDFSGTVSVSAQANYAGYYANSDGKLGSNKVIQDNHYYQDFSYVMLAEITIDRYRDVIKKLLNPAGMAFFGKILLKRCAAAELNQSTALAQYEVPLIGNYLPYTFITYEDLSKWFVKTITVNGKVQTTIDGYNRNMQESVIRNDYTKDGIVDGQDYDQWLSMHPQDTSTEKQFIQKIGNPFASQNVNPGTDGNPLLRQGSTEHPFWIVYQHPNRKVADTVVARIPYDLKNDFLSNHGALALTGSENFPWNYPMPVWNPSATGVSGVLGFAASAGEAEASPTGLVVGWGRNPSTGFSGNNECFGTNSDGTEIYEKAGTEWNPIAFPVRRAGSTGTGMYGDPVKILGNRLENVTKVITVGKVNDGVTIALKDSGIIAWGNSDISIMSIPVSARSDVSNFNALVTYDSGNLKHKGQIHAIKTDGRVFSWGDNAYGECGGVDAAGKGITSPSSTGQYLKIGASDLTGAVQIERTKNGGSNDRRYALLNTGKVVTWAKDGRILGTSSTGANIQVAKFGYTGSSYISVMGNTLTGAIQIATGSNHTIALKSNGTVVALDTYSVVPTGLTGVVSIVAFRNSSSALLSDGTIRIWGESFPWPTGTDYTGNNIAGPSTSSVYDRTHLGWTGNSPYKIWGETLTGITALFAPNDQNPLAYLYAKKQDGRLIPIHGNSASYPSKLGYDKFADLSKSAATGGASGNTAGNLFDWYQSGGDIYPFDGRFTKASSCNGGLTSISCSGMVCVGIKDGLDSFPDITSITGATYGPSSGGTQFTVIGTEFHSDSIVKIDGVTAASATINSPTSITVTTPAAKTLGTKVVSVENVCGFAGMTAAFTYLSGIQLASATPNFGYTVGGTSVLLSGNDLSGITSVIFGGVSATGLAGNTSTNITVTAPAHSAGTVDISVISPAGTSTLTNGFNYIVLPPTISTIGPTSGPVQGETTITIIGTNLITTMGVSVGGNAAKNIVKVNDTQITAVTPAGTTGGKPVVVTTSGGSATKINGFTYTSVSPTISFSVSPNFGPTTGGTPIGITGTNLTGTTSVTVDGATATSLIVVSSTQITAVTPAGTLGAKPVVVTISGVSTTKTDGFTYISNVPTISSYGDGILPNSGPTVGGTAITITGTNFLTGTTVTVDGNSATSVVVVSSTKVTAITPAGTLGAKHITVTTSGGTATAHNAFTYVDPAPVIDSSGNGVIPNKGPTTGGTPITILGNYFNGANKVTVGGKLATNVVVVSKTIITAVTPSGSQGTKDISVTTASGTGFLRNAFTYYLAIYSGPIHIEGAWPEWNESITANREYWTREFTEGDRYVSLSYNPLVPLYQDTPGSDGATGLSVYKNTTSTVYGNPTNLYDSFVVDGRDWSKEQLEALGPSFVGGKRCYKFTETELNLVTNRTTESIVNSLETWLYSQGFNRTTQEYVILKLNQENTLEMIQVLRGIKRLFPEAKFGYYDYPKIPSFVLVIEQQYNSFEYLSDASRNTIIENTTNSIYDLIKEQDLIVLDMHFSSPSLAKMKVLAAAKIKVADRLNEKLVAEGLRRKVVIVATSRIWKTNSTETPIWVRSNEPEIAQSTRDQYYIPEYSVVKPSTFINTFKDIIGIVAGESRFTGNGYRTIDGYYNDLDPQFLLQAALGSTHTDYVNSIYNDVPLVLNANRSINTDSYQTLIRKSLSTYVNYSKGVTGSTEFYSATGATASNWHYDYWFPLVNKKISSIPSGYLEIKTDILYNAIYPIYYKFNYLISMAYSAAGQDAGGFNLSGNLLGSWPTSDTDSPEVATLLGDRDGSGIIDTGDTGLILLFWGEGQTANPEYRYDAPWTKTDGEVILPTNKLLGYKIAYSDFRKITARSFFEMPVGREFNCTTDEVTAPPVPVVFAAKINGSAYPLQANYDHTDASNLVTGGENLVLHLEAERGITGTPTEGISSLVYLGYYGIRSLWAELYAVKPSEAGNAEIEYQIANAGPFKPTSSIISINTPFPNFENPNTTNEMFTANYRISDSSSFLFGGANIVKNNFFMRLKLVFRNGSNSAVPNATKVMDFNYNRT